MVAGHVVECGAQATGGNFSGFTAADRPLGFPLVEIAADGSCVVTKHDGTGGQVSVDTVTAQLVYEIQSATYLGPDVSVHLDSLVLTPDGPDRVRISGATGSPPPETLKVCVNELGGFRNQAELVLVGLDVEEKAAWVRVPADRRARRRARAVRPRSSSGRWPAPTTWTPTPRRPRPAGCGSRCGTPTPPGSARSSPPRSSSSRWRRTPASR